MLMHSLSNYSKLKYLAKKSEIYTYLRQHTTNKTTEK